MNWRILFAAAAAALLGGGCGSPRKEELRVPDPREFHGENREWWDIYSVEFKDDRKVRSRVGYLYRKYDQRDPKGMYWVRDLALRDIGFLNSENQVFLIAEPAEPGQRPKAQLLGTTDLHGGIRKILRLQGTLELERAALPRSEGSERAAK